MACTGVLSGDEAGRISRFYFQGAADHAHL